MTENNNADNTNPTLLNNNGGAAEPLPILPLESIDPARWTLVRDDHIMSEARSRAALNMRATKALTDKRKSLREIMSETI